MSKHALALGISAALLATTACSGGNGSKNGTADEQKTAQTPQAEKAAGNKTIAAGLAGNSQFMTVAKAAGLDQTLAGPGPYTVFVPTDAAFAATPEGTFATTPDNRAQLTGTLTNLILPGTVLVADIAKTIDANKGKGTLATMGGGTLTATKDGDKIVISDSAGHKATIVKPDEQFSNGVVQEIDAVLMPSKQAAKNAPAVGQKAGK